MFFRRFLPEHEIEWQVETYAWLIKTYLPRLFFEETALVRPTHEFFKTPPGVDHATATAIFNEVRALMGMTHWPVNLIAQEHDIDPSLGALQAVENAPSGPGGTYQADWDGVVITYNPRLLDHPTALIAVFAHELCHYLTLSRMRGAPGGTELTELNTDLAAVYAGFGLFLLEAAFLTERLDPEVGYQGWRISRQGYLSAPHLAYAIALFLRVKGVEPEAAIEHLSSRNVGLLRRALKTVDRRPADLERLLKLKPEGRLKIIAGIDVPAGSETARRPGEWRPRLK